MRTYLLTFIFALLGCVSLAAQQQVRYGTLSREALLQAMPEAKMAHQQMDSLRVQYEREAQYNERNFRRQYSEYLQSQKNMPQAILLKRQRDLQAAMEGALAYRSQAEHLLAQAEKDLYAPLQQRLDEAIRAVGRERGYDAIVNTDVQSHLYLNPTLTEDATPWVKMKLNLK